jgi:hypothetical protein
MAQHIQYEPRRVDVTKENLVLAGTNIIQPAASHFSAFMKFRNEVNKFMSFLPTL